MKEKLLYLCHRIPYPPNKGDKIAAYNILKFLTQYYDVYLGCFIDDPEDKKYQDYVRSLCKEAYFVDLNPSTAKVRGMKAFLSNDPITVPYYYNSKLLQWVNTTLSGENVNKAFMFSGCMGQYIMRDKYPNLHTVMHFVDIDSDKWRQYAEKKRGIMRWVYQREYRTLERYEKYLAENFSVSCFVTNAETAMFQDLTNNHYKDKIKTLSNGIDSKYFSPSAECKLAENYSIEEQNYLVFTGAMDYWANVDAVTWFAKHVWPNIQVKSPDSYFYIVGSSPTKQVIELQNIPGIIVTGRVDDVRPYLLNAKASVASMQIARGVQNKILEAMSMGCPVTATPLGIEGIEGVNNLSEDELYISNSPEDITQWVLNKLSDEKIFAKTSRRWLQDHYSWEAKLTPLKGYLGSYSG